MRHGIVSNNRRKSSKIQIAHLEKIGKSQDQQDQKLADLIREVQLLRQDIHHPHTSNYHARSYSAVECGRPPTPTNVVLEPAMYEEGRKSFIDVTDFLDSVSRVEAESHSMSAEEQEIVSKIKSEYINSRNRIQVSIERNKSKGAQIARAEIPQSSESSRKRTESEDSGYATSVRSLDPSETPWSYPASSSRQPTNRASGSSEQTWNWPTFPRPSSRRPSEESSGVSTVLTVSQATM